MSIEQANNKIKSDFIQLRSSLHNDLYYKLRTKYYIESDDIRLNILYTDLLKAVNNLINDYYWLTSISANTSNLYSITCCLKQYSDDIETINSITIKAENIIDERGYSVYRVISINNSKQKTLEIF